MSTVSNMIIDNITMFYGDFKALDNVSLEVNHGEFLTILGPSGSGKTTLLKVIAGFEPIAEGKLLLNNENIVHQKANERNLGILFQNYALFPHMNVFNNIAYPLKIRKIPRKKIKKLVEEVLKLVKMEEFIHRFPDELSGGQQQRIALARAIVYEPPILLLDEPLSALDKNLRQQMQLEIKRLQQTLGITTISVTHDQEEAMTMSDRICVMNDGRIEQIGSPEEIYLEPKNEFIAKFIGEINLIAGTVSKIEDEYIKVSIGETNVLAKRPKIDKFNVEDHVNIAIRPEKIYMKNKATDYDNNIQVNVEEKIYMGDSYKLNTRMGSDSEIIIKTPDLDNVTGDNLELGWNASDTIILRR